jgi:hypothetical protein
MKKYLTIALTAAFVGVTHAASLSWSAFNIYEPKTTTPADGYAIYLFITEQNDDFGVDVTTKNDVQTLLTSGASVVTEAGKTYLQKGTTSIAIAAIGESSGGRIATAATGYNGDSFGSGDSLKGFAVILDAATLATAKNFTVTDEKSASWTSSMGAKTLAFGNQANATWTAVPEPSVALMGLLGLGMLLKRRKA